MTQTVDRPTGAQHPSQQGARRGEHRWPTIEGGTGPKVELDRSTRDIVYLQVDGSALELVTHRPSLFTYIARLWQRRHFILADASARVRAGTRATILGSAWLVLQPMLNAAGYMVIFGLIMKSNRGIENFLGYLIIGVFMFQFTSKCISAGGQSLLAGRSMMRAFAFPRASLPLSAVWREVIGYSRTLAAMVVMLVLIPPGVDVSWRWVLVPAAVLLQMMFGTGLALFTARIQARVPDVQKLISVLTRFWLYSSAVFFSYERFIDNPVMLRVISLNPMFQVLDITRDCLLYGVTPEPWAWMVLGSWSVAALVGGFLFFWAGEERYGVG